MILKGRKRGGHPAGSLLFCGSSRGRDMAEAVNGEPEAVGGGAWQRRRGIHRPGKAEKGRKSEI